MRRLDDRESTAHDSLQKHTVHSERATATMACLALSATRGWWILVFVALVACTAAPTIIVAKSNPADCPNLSGTYEEMGIKRDSSQRATDKRAHLSDLILGSHLAEMDVQYDPAKAALYERPRPGNAMRYFARTVRISHPAPDRIELRAFDETGAPLGTFQIGAEHGWLCRDAAFVAEGARRFGGGDGTPVVDITREARIVREADGSLVITTHSSIQKISMLLLGSPVGAPAVTDTREEFHVVE